jgi:hypothetical protein
MIISHKNKYLFVALPQTGSTAISHELRLNYDGEPILTKHATYEDFCKIATPEEKKYFVFSCIRNPMDYTVSQYFKYLTDHKHKYTDPDRVRKVRGVVGHLFLARFHFVHEAQPDFAAYFKKYYRTPYNNWSSLSHKDFDYIIRYERLQDDFAQALRRMGLEPKRPLPQINDTAKKKCDYVSYYTPDTIAHAKRIFGPFMREWGYEFPPEWGENKISPWNRFQFNFLNLFRTLYWKYLRYRI